MAVFTSIGAAIFGAGTFLATATAFLLKTAVGITLNLLAASRAGKQAQPSFAVNGQIQGGGDISRSLPLGFHATAGSLVWANTWGSDGDAKNAFLTQVIAVSDLPIKGVSGVFVNKQRVTVDYTRPHPDGRGYPVTEYRKDGKDNLWLKFYDGTQTTADNFLVTRASNANRSYSNKRVGKGIGYVIATSLSSKNMFSGFPQFLFEIDGMKLYDPSRDSSVGGVGSQTFSDPSTWGGDGDNNPAVQLYNLMRGVRYNGVWMYGLQGVTATRLPAASWIKQINKCRLASDGAPTYRSGGECPVEAPLTSAVDALLTACQGSLAESGGAYELLVGAPDDPEFHITDWDIITTETQQFTPFFGLANMVTGMSGTYPAPNEGWSAKTAPPIIRPDLDALAGNRRLMSNVPFDFVPYPEQVQRLLKSGLLDGLRQRRHTFTLPAKYMPACKPNRTISWTSERNGYINKLFRIDGAQILENCNVLIDVTECDPADYDWSSSEFKPPIDGITGPVRPLPTPIYNFAAEPSSINDDDGDPRRAAILLKWKAIDGVDFVEYELELSSNLSLVDNGYFVNVELSQDKIAPFTLLPNTSYRVRARYGTYESGAPFNWSEWIQVLTPDIRLGLKDIYPIDIGELNKDVIALQEWVSESGRYTREELERIGAWAADQEFGNFTERQIMRNEITLEFENTRADYQHLVEVAVGPGSAIVTRIENLEVKIDQDLASAISLLQAEINTVDGKTNANATAITALTATVNDVSADANFRMGVVAAPSGWTSRIAMQVRVGSGDTYKDAGLYMDATTTSSRITLSAEQIVFTNGPDDRKPFVYQGNELYLTNVRLDTLKFNQLESNNGKLIMRGYADFADIRMWT